jgi:hypothetical protein
MLGETGRHLRWNVASAGMNRADHREQVVLGHALEHVSRGSRPERTLDLAIAVRRAQHDDSSFGKLSANRDQGIGAVGSRKPEIHQRDVRPLEAKCGQRLARIGRQRDENHIRLRSDDRAQAFPKHRVVFDAQDANRLGMRHTRLCVRAVYLIVSLRRWSDGAGGARVLG